MSKGRDTKKPKKEAKPVVHGATSLIAKASPPPPGLPKKKKG
jgi:hypothetical protein